MLDCQEEYLANLRQAAALSLRERPEGMDREAYIDRMLENRGEFLRLSRRNMALLRSELFPLLDELFRLEPEQVKDLEEFSFQLYDGRTELDVGLFCQIHQALLSLIRHREDRNALIRELYWLGMGYNALYSKLVGLDLQYVGKYNTQMRQYFTEAAAYLKDYDEIDDTQTRGYILRAKANMALGQFPTPGEKIRRNKQALDILQDKHRREKAPDLPWDRFIYLTRQNITSSISHSREKTMTPDEMAAIMESAVIVYRQRFEVGSRLHQQPPAKAAFGYYAIEYYCGLYDLDTFLSRLEMLMSGAKTSDRSPDGMYAIISLPAFYSQYLSQYPDRIPYREGYLQWLYRRALDYADAYPGQLGDRSLFLYLRQLCFTYVETKDGIPYSVFLENLLLRFAPEVYCHSRIVGEGAKVLCAALLERDPAFFDDIGFLRDIADPGEKRTAALDYAMGCGLFHDVGKISVIELYTRTARQWFEEEYEMAFLHTLAGEALLESRASTSRYAPAALGHHVWYDESQGYPAGYRRSDCSARRMVDVIGLVDWLEILINSTPMYHLERKTFDEAIREAGTLAGGRFSPLLTACLEDGETLRRLQAALKEGALSACRRMYEDALQAGTQ